MAAKRTATSEVNHTNWHLDEEPEDAGTFSKAPEDVIKNRVIKVAKRRNPIGTLAASEGEKKSAFMNFGGFGKASPAAATTSASFGFLTNLSNKSEDQPKTNGLNNTALTKTASTEAPSINMPLTKNITKQTHTNKSKDYYAKLKGLNESVSNWIKKHVDANPLLNLTPIFRDYENYLEELDKLHKDDEILLTSKDSELKTVTSTTKTERKVVNTFTVKPSEENKSENKTFTSIFTNTMTTKVVEGGEQGQPKSDTFSFSARAPETTTLTAPTFSFGKANVTPTTSTAGFSFGSDASKPFTFSNVSKPTDAEDAKTEKEEDDDEPPKVEFTPVVEEGHIYTIRCKMFVKKDGKFGDRGVGNLYLKPIPDSDKVQLILRADTSLGNLLCNFILSSNIPMQRMGKKDVMLVCIPTPDSKPPPAPVLFRVKSPEEADELLRTLEKHKK